jgi:hypothetical protein
VLGGQEPAHSVTDILQQFDQQLGFAWVRPWVVNYSRPKFVTSALGK